MKMREKLISEGAKPTYEELKQDKADDQKEGQPWCEAYL